MEYQRWRQYIARRGSLHVGMRIEEGIARWMAAYFNFNTKMGGKKITDFMPNYVERPITLEEAMERWV